MTYVVTEASIRGDKNASYFSILYSMGQEEWKGVDAYNKTTSAVAYRTGGFVYHA